MRFAGVASGGSSGRGFFRKKIRKAYTAAEDTTVACSACIHKGHASNAVNYTWCCASNLRQKVRFRISARSYLPTMLCLSANLGRRASVSNICSVTL